MEEVTLLPLMYGICYIINIIGKCVVSYIISNKNNMSDEKIKHITKMMSKDININLHK